MSGNTHLPKVSSRLHMSAIFRVFSTASGTSANNFAARSAEIKEKSSSPKENLLASVISDPV